MTAFLRAGVVALAVVGIFVFLGETLTRISGQSAVGASTVGVSPEAGEAIFWGKGKCSTCHSVGDQGSAVRCPNLGAAPGRQSRPATGRMPQSGAARWEPIGARAASRAEEIEKQQGRRLSPADYLIESMAKPDAYVVEGYKNEMPVIWKPPIALEPDEMKAVALYLMSQGGVPDPGSLTMPDYVKGSESGGEEGWKPYMDGDPEAGEVLFFGEDGPGCSKCHRIGDRGGQVGPDLSHVGGTRTPQFIIESILNPNAETASGFEVMEVQTKDMDRIRGIKKAEDDRSLTLALQSGEHKTIDKSEIETSFLRKESMMPGNFAELVTVDQLHHLLSFLVSRE